MSRKRKNKLARLQGGHVTEAPPKAVQERQRRALTATRIAMRATSGPIPSAEELLRYQQVQPDLPERIMRQFERRTDMAEAQSQHRMRMEWRVVGNNILMERLGWFSATLLGVLGLGGSLYLIYLGRPLTGLGGVIVSLGALLGLYVWARRDQIQEVTKKRAADLVKQGAEPEQLDLMPIAKDG